MFPFTKPSNVVAVRMSFANRIADVKQVFFRAGVLGQMEEFRDERLSRIMSWIQAWARGFLTRKVFKKLQEQRMALTVVQRSLRRYLKLRTWPWWKLWQKVKPLLNASRVEDQIAVSFTHTNSQTFDWFNCKLHTFPKQSYETIFKYPPRDE